MDNIKMRIKSFLYDIFYCFANSQKTFFTTDRLQLILINRNGKEKTVQYNMQYFFTLVVPFILVQFLFPITLHGQSLDLSIKRNGLSVGNSRIFNGLRINFSDRRVEKINGMNITLWRSKANTKAIVRGLSIGLWGPQAGYLKGLQIGALEIGAEHEIKGVSIAPGVGSCGYISGITVGIVGVAAYGYIKGLTFGSLGVYSRNDIDGVTLGGLVVGANNDLNGVTIALLGAGARRNIRGMTLCGLGVLARGNISGVSFAFVGVGSEENIRGINIAGVVIDSGNELKGLSLTGFCAKARHIKGLTLALGTVRAFSDGSMSGISISAFNQIKGKQTGVSLGLINFARELSGVQFGLINYVRENPKLLRILPILNLSF